jgi:hypothetical protein
MLGQHVRGNPKNKLLLDRAKDRTRIEKVLQETISFQPFQVGWEPGELRELPRCIDFQKRIFEIVGILSLKGRDSFNNRSDALRSS